MDARGAYEREVLSGFARLAGRCAPGLSDADRDREYRAQQLFYGALDRFRGAVETAAPLTELRKRALADLLSGLADATPSRTAWDEAIAEAIHHG